MNLKPNRDKRTRATQTIPWALVRRTLAFLLPHRATLFLATISTAAITGLWFTGPYLLRRLTDTAITGDFRTFTWLVAASFCAALLRMVGTYAQGVSVAAVGALAVRDVRDRLTEHIQRLPMPTLEKYHSGDLVSRVNHDLEKTVSLYRRAPDYLHRPLQLIGGLLFMFLISPKLTLVVCASMPISVVIFERVVRAMQKHSGKKMEALAEANVTLQDAIRGASIVRAFGLQNVLGGRFQRQANDVQQHEMRNQVRRILSFIPFLTLRYIPQLLVPIYGGLLAFRGEISVGDLLAVNWLIWPVFEPLEAFLGWIREMRETAPALRRMYEILDAPAERTGGNRIDALDGDTPIAFESVSFGYNGNGHVLDGLTFRVEKGTTIALVGSSGCGKSTILKLLCGFIAPDDGGVRVFGSPIATSDLASLRDHVSLMAQDPFLFPTTIEQNIAWGRADASREEVIAAAQAASAHDFIRALPKGYETPVGELGNRLSGGEKQRICLARMILKNAPILLLDEPTASLDTQSEAMVLNALDRLMAGRTTVIVSHRLSSLKKVDEILVVDGGRIRARGTHDELLVRDDLYRQLAQRQTNGVESPPRITGGEE